MKPGIQSSEFKISLIVLMVQAVILSGVFPPTAPWVLIVASLCNALVGAGYTLNRFMLKSQQMENEDVPERVGFHQPREFPPPPRGRGWTPPIEK